MNKKHLSIMCVMSLLGGLIGGFLFNSIIAGEPAYAKRTERNHIKTIAAEKFVIIDENDDIRAVLGIANKEPTLMMFGKENSLPRLMLFDSKRCRAELFLDQKGEPSLNLYGKDNTIRTALGNVKLKDTKGEIQDLQSTLVFFDEKGQVSWSAHKN
jgi:hypothetical protein